MNIAAIAQVRDECDIIELFARINCRVFDHLYIIDNNSADATPHILKKLQEQGYPITTTFDGDNTYNQDGLTTKALYSVNALGIYDWIFFLDADEFVDEPKDDLIAKLNDCPKNFIPKALWRSWIVTDTTYAEHKNPLYTIFRPLKHENFNTYKAIIDRARAPHVKITHGNHGWLDKNGKEVPDKYTGIRINHFPIRSPEQITSKAVLSHYRQIVRHATKNDQNRQKELGPVRHFFQLASIHSELQKSNYLITKKDLRRWSVLYNTEIVGNSLAVDSAIETEHFGFEDDIIEWPELARIALGARFDKQMDIMHGVIISLMQRIRGMSPMP